MTVTAATGLCLFGTGLPAASADTGPSTSALVRAAKAAPWKTALTRGVRNGSTPRVTPAAVVPPAITPAAVVPPAAVATVVDPSVAFAAKIASLVNVERAKVGLAPLTGSTCAQRFGVTWSRHMAATRDFSHQSLTPIMTGCGARGAGENIAYGASTPEQFMSMWMNSAGHKANILRASFTHIGVGVATSPAGSRYATQDFLTL